MKYVPLFIALFILVSITFGVYYIITSFLSAAVFPRQNVFKFLEKNNSKYISHSLKKKSALIDKNFFNKEHSIFQYFIYKNYYFEIISRKNTDNQIMKYYLKFSKSRSILFDDELWFEEKEN